MKGFYCNYADRVTRKAATYSPTIVVPLALTGLTSLFGMVRGEPRCYNHLKLLIVVSIK